MPAIGFELLIIILLVLTNGVFATVEIAVVSDAVKNQIAGNVLHTVSRALREEVTFVVPSAIQGAWSAEVRRDARGAKAQHRMRAALAYSLRCCLEVEREHILRVLWDTHGMIRGPPAPRGVSASDAQRSGTKWRSLTSRASHSDSMLTPVEHFRHRPMARSFHTLPSPSPHAAHGLVQRTILGGHRPAPGTEREMLE